MFTAALTAYTDGERLLPGFGQECSCEHLADDHVPVVQSHKNVLAFRRMKPAPQSAENLAGRKRVKSRVNAGLSKQPLPVCMAEVVFVVCGFSFR